MYRFFYTSLLLCFPFIELLAQNYTSTGARANGMGGAVVTLSDDWATFQNVAGLAGLNRISAGLWYKKGFAQQATNETAAQFVIPLLKGGMGISVFKFGDELFSVSQVSIGYAHKINFVSLGLKLNYLQMAIKDLGLEKSISLDFGGIAELVPSKLFFGATIYNLSQTTFRNELFPVVMKAGLSYRPNSKLMLNTELEKDLVYKSTVKIGLEYFIIKKVCLRTGITTHPYVNFFGAGFHHSSIKLDYALSRHTQLGYTHELSLLLYFNKLK